MTTLATYQNYFFVGIGGIGMSALARYFHASGKQVFGYDKTRTKLTAALVGDGIEVLFEDATTEKISRLNPENTLIVFTPAIKKLALLDHFAEKGFRILKRAEVLGMITKNTTCIAIAGTHGKTTTSSLVAHLCREAGLPFSCFLGGIAENFKSNFYFQGTEISVVEADEYDRSFLHLSPDWAVITSTDADHLDIYGDRETIEKGFQDFAALVEDDERLFIRKGVNVGRGAQTYAANETADYFSDAICEVGDFTEFRFHARDQSATFRWEIPGTHNVENATAALAVMTRLGVEIDTLQKAILIFKGIKRRYTKYKSPAGRIYIDDYAHHPTELNAVIGSVRTFYPDKKLLVVFQPHLFSRSRDFADNFADSLANADELLLLDIYPARELPENYPGISSPWLLEKVDLAKKEVSSLEEALEKIKEKDFDILLTAGAGNIDILYDDLVHWLSADVDTKKTEQTAEGSKK